MRDGSDGPRTRDLRRRRLTTIDTPIALLMRFSGLVPIRFRMVERSRFRRLLPVCCPGRTAGRTDSASVRSLRGASCSCRAIVVAQFGRTVAGCRLAQAAVDELDAQGGPIVHVGVGSMGSRPGSQEGPSPERGPSSALQPQEAVTPRSVRSRTPRRRRRSPEGFPTARDGRSLPVAGRDGVALCQHPAGELVRLFVVSALLAPFPIRIRQIVGYPCRLVRFGPNELVVRYERGVALPADRDTGGQRHMRRGLLAPSERVSCPPFLSAGRAGVLPANEPKRTPRCPRCPRWTRGERRGFARASH
jgi:hypothetical protein